MAIVFYNSLTRSKEPFVPLAEGEVRLYTCGPTVYASAHVGNFRAYVFEDVLRRHLEYRGYRVLHVMNLTDVDDKTIRGARAQGLALSDYVAPFVAAFHEDVRELRIEPAHHYPAATAHVPQMIALIGRLLEKGFAYQAEDGSVYFRIAAFEGYGKLAHLDRAGLRAGARVAHDEYDKETAADFALWKAWDEADGAVAWESPWGRGRPGWHIECSAMSMHYLGETLDIHTGGVDNMFPHHEDEIAQSEAATGKPFVRYWLHCDHLIVDGRKMAKSLGNFFTVRDLLAQGCTGREIRFELLKGHYRQQLNFTMEGLCGARQALGRVDELRQKLSEIGAGAGGAASMEPRAEAAVCVARAHSEFGRALDDDLNMPGALAALFELVREVNRLLDARLLGAAEAGLIESTLEEMDRVLGVLDRPGVGGVPEEIEALARRRQEARSRRAWAESDALREELRVRGWVIEDTPQGYRLKEVEKEKRQM